PYDPLWWIKKLLEREKLSVLPLALEVRAKVDRALETLGRLRREEEVRELVGALNADIARANRTTIAGPATNLAPLHVDTVAAGWRRRRTGACPSRNRARASRRRPAYFTLPAVRPPTRYGSMRAKSTTTGTMAITHAAKSRFQYCTYAVTYEVMPTVSGYRAASVIRVSATMYSFHAAMKVKIRAVTIPGKDRGSTILTSTPSVPHPSTAAASSISLGRETKNARRIQIAKARLKAALVRISAA